MFAPRAVLSLVVLACLSNTVSAQNSPPVPVQQKTPTPPPEPTPTPEPPPPHHLHPRRRLSQSRRCRLLLGRRGCHRKNIVKLDVYSLYVAASLIHLD